MLVVAAGGIVSLRLGGKTSSASIGLRPPDGGARYYAKYPHSLPADPAFFPIAVWFESVLSPADVAADKAAGLNTYLALTANSDLRLLAPAGMKAVVQHYEWLDRATAPGSEAIAGWLLGDEVDMQEGPEQGPVTLDRVRRKLPAGDGRLRYSNYGKGVTFWETDAEAARFVNDFQDVVSADNYWFTDLKICGRSEGAALLLVRGRELTPAECHLAANYGRTVDRVRSLISPAGSRPVWNFVEVGHPASEAAWPSIQPAQVSAAVWSGIIHGARGVAYFNHSFGGPAPTQHALREKPYAAVRAEVTRTNDRIRRLARVLNAPFVDGLVTVTGAVDVMAKHQAGAFYLFAGANTAGGARAAFSAPCVGDATVTVLDEDRSIPLRGGGFTDTFADGNAVHIYRIDGGSTCGLPAGQPIRSQ